MLLTEISIKALLPPPQGQRIYKDDTVTGFGVRVSQGGSKSYVLTVGKARSTLTIGRVGVIKLADARAEAKRILAEHTLGKHRPKATTFSDALPAFIEDRYRTKRDSTKEEMNRLLTRHFLPGFRDLNLTDIATDDVKRRLDRLKKTPSEQLHAFRAIRCFMRWSVKQRLIGHNPVEPLSAPGEDTVRERVLTDEEIKAIWKACTGTMGGIIKLLYLTAQRKSQFADLRWKWISDEAITWPAGAMKGDREHVIPLTSRQSQILAATPRLSEEWVFPSSRLETPFSGFSKVKRKLEKDSGVEDWHIHDLRRTAATKIAAHTEPHVLQVILAHSTGPISAIQAIYNKWSYFEEKKAALERHEKDLERLLKD